MSLGEADGRWRRIGAPGGEGPGRRLSQLPGVPPASSSIRRGEAAVADSRLRLCWHTAAAAGSAAVERPALLLLHGIGTTHDDFTTLAHGLAAKFQVLAPDLPGHGPSTAVPVAPTVAGSR